MLRRWRRTWKAPVVGGGGIWLVVTLAGGLGDWSAPAIYGCYYFATIVFAGLVLWAKPKSLIIVEEEDSDS